MLDLSLFGFGLMVPDWVKNEEGRHHQYHHPAFSFEVCSQRVVD